MLNPSKKSIRGLLTATALAVAGSATALAAGAARNAPSSPATTTPGMSGMSSSAAMRGVPTVEGASLPTMSSSGSMPAPMTMVPLGQARWQGMKIQARTSAPATFALLSGSKQKLVRPTGKDSFHLMVMLSDASTGMAIPYSSVWATITSNGKVVFDERLWPMISRYMGPHYGNNVALPRAGTYTLSVLISPPQAARHMEYENHWLKPDRVKLTFRWVPKR